MFIISDLLIIFHMLSCSFVFSQKGEGSSDPSHTGRWNSLELVKGTFGPDDCINDIAEIKFDRPLPITVRLMLLFASKTRK